MADQPPIDLPWSDEDMVLFGQYAINIKPEDQYNVILPETAELDQDISVFDWEGLTMDEVPTLVPTSEDELLENLSSPDSSTDFCNESVSSPVAGRQVDALLNVYALDDNSLSDITLKKLKSLCHSTADYNKLKNYRRTCLNRHYARSSRTKQQNKTSSLAQLLKKSQEDVARLQQENDMKDATIRCLQLELEIMRTLRE